MQIAKNKYTYRKQVSRRHPGSLVLTIGYTFFGTYNTCFLHHLHNSHGLPNILSRSCYEGETLSFHPRSACSSDSDIK